jgi:hypothetical protein
MIGNQAVQRLLEASTRNVKGDSVAEIARFGHDFSRIPVNPNAHAEIQPKLTINTPGDIYVQEADRAAEQVTRRPEPTIDSSEQQEGSRRTTEPLVQRKPAVGGSVSVSQEFDPQTQSERSDQTLSSQERFFFEPRFGHDFSQVRIHADARFAEMADALNADAFTVGKRAGGSLQRAAIHPSSFSPHTSEVPPIVSEVLRSPGQPLDAVTRAFFEPRFGHDFSQVRVHSDARASQSARAVNALAYTVNRDIVFGNGQYSPATGASRNLIAHELAHVVQQSSSGASGGGNETSLEAEADVAADAVLCGSDAPRLSVASSGVQRRVEMRGVGRGEASGLPRLQELIARLNTISTALIFSVSGTVLSFVENPYGTQTEFDRQMMAFIGDRRILPLRLTTRQALQGDRVAGFDTPVDVDGYNSGYVDIDDLLASSDLGLQTSLVHLLRERAETRDYARRMGIDAGSGALLPNAEFDRSHARGIESELALLRDFFGDPGIRIIDADQRHFRSTRGDGIHETQRHGRGRAESGIFAISWEVRLRDGRRMTPEQYRDLLAAERAAAAPVAAPAVPAPVAP